MVNDTINFKFGVNGSMRMRETPTKTEYYLFNAFDQMKAYSDNGETYGYYGYDAGGDRKYKIQLNNSVIQTNTYGGKVLDVEKVMYYPNGYINIDQAGNYTKHYYADAQRIASKIGNGTDNNLYKNRSCRIRRQRGLQTGINPKIFIKTSCFLHLFVTFAL